ncbi:MAG: cysteine--tRNA ligase, partial [Gammaproteobacteria bacterium]
YEENLGGVHPLYEVVKDTEEKFFKALSEDFKTQEALASYMNLISEMNKLRNQAFKEKKISSQALEAYGYAVNSVKNTLRNIFGLLEDVLPRCPVKEVVKKELEPASAVLDEELINLLVEVRQMAREKKLFDIADKIRDRLKEKGIILEDTPFGTKWKKV